MASTDPGLSVGLQHQNDELVKTPVQVLWTPAEAEPDSSPWTLPLVLRIHYNPALALAYFQLQHRHVTVKNGASKKSFYLYVPLERIDRLTLARTEYSAALDKDAYRLDIVLTEPLDLVGPPGHGCQEGWPGGKITTEKLRSLAATVRFSLLAPSAAVPKMKLADFCAAASRGLRSLATLYDTNTLYAGVGGHLFVRPRAPAPSPLVNNADPSPSHVSIVPREYAAPGPSHVPSVPLMPGGVPKHSVPSPQSDVSTVPVETPPRYRDDMALPEYSHVERGGPSKALDLDAHHAEAKTPAGKRPTSREPDPCPPSKRRFEDPSLLLDGEFPASWDESRLSPFSSALASGDVLGREREPSLDTLVRLLMAQNQAYAIQYRAQQDTIDELRNELCQLARKHADHERQVAQQQELAEQATVMRARQDQMERLLTTLCRDVAALEKEAADVPQQLQAVRAEIERAVRTGVADALRGVATDDYLREVVTNDSLRGLVTDVVHDFFDELPPVVEDAIEDRVRDFVKSRVELFSAQLRQVFEEGA